MVLPLLKLGTLALKTLSKPVANRLKQQAAIHPRFRQLIIDMAQKNHRFTTQMQRRIYGHATDVEIRPLNEEKAVQAAVAGVAVILEVQRSARSEARKEEVRKQELEKMRQRDEDIAREVELLKHKLEELEHMAKGRGLSGMFNFKQTNTDNEKPAKPA
ncbi:opa3-like protein [Quercus suber]|uniref:Opa3-like protein n=1 Tax=Quercus suber TaxID=58331 RepID=A0AAW0JTT5_QUESU